MIADLQFKGKQILHMEKAELLKVVEYLITHNQRLLEEKQRERKMWLGICKSVSLT